MLSQTRPMDCLFKQMQVIGIHSSVISANFINIVNIIIIIIIINIYIFYFYHLFMIMFDTKNLINDIIIHIFKFDIIIDSINLYNLF